MIRLTSLVVLAGAGLAGIALTGPDARADDPAYSFKLDVPAAQAGQRTVVRLHVRPSTGYHMNKEFPTALTVTAPAGVAVEKPKQSGKDAVKLEEAGADFDVALTAAAAGQKALHGELKFAVCSATSCDPKKQAFDVTVTVK